MRKLTIILCIVCYLGLLKIPLLLAEWAGAAGAATVRGRSSPSRR